MLKYTTIELQIILWVGVLKDFKLLDPNYLYFIDKLFLSAKKELFSIFLRLEIRCFLS